MGSGMRRTILWIAMILAVLSGCTKDGERSNPSVPLYTEFYYSNFFLNNDVPLEMCTQVSYEIQTMRDYFGEISLSELVTRHLGKPFMGSTIYIDEANKHFPITNLRQATDPLDGSAYGNPYSVYRITEGGYFYVFWDIFSDDSLDSNETWRHGVPIAAQTMYLKETPSNLDFSHIEPGKSTAEDVAKVDPNIAITFGGMIFSHSYIDYYCLVRVNYEVDLVNKIDDGITERKELKVASIKTLTGLTNSGEPVGSILRIREEDLP